MSLGNLRILAGALATAVGLMLAVPAMAQCDIESEPFFMHKNDKSNHRIATDSSGCELNFSTDAKTKFHSATVTTRPRNGKLVKIAHLEFVYHPRPGFKGEDAFAMKVCGASMAGRGCSLLNYSASVK